MTLHQLLQELPASVQIDESIAWLTLNKTNDGFQAGYLHGDAIYERKLMFESPNPQQALKLLSEAIKEYT